MRAHLLLGVLILMLAACKGKDSKPGDKAYEQSKKTLADKEKDNPENFLSITAHDKKSLFGIGRQTIVKGQVTNVATVCSYKDVRVKMLCYQDGRQVEEHEDVMGDVIPPGASASYRTHYKLPKGTDSIALSIMSATALVDTTKK